MKPENSLSLLRQPIKADTLSNTLYNVPKSALITISVRTQTDN
jgi:hypothetical protein